MTLHTTQIHRSSFGISAQTISTPAVVRENRRYNCIIVCK